MSSSQQSRASAPQGRSSNATPASMPPIDWTKTIAIWERIQKTKEKDASEHELMFTSLSEAEKLMKDAPDFEGKEDVLAVFSGCAIHAEE
jgi:hypothetical protein